MQGVGVIARVFQLAEQAQSVDEIRKGLNREGYTSVEAHLSGMQIRRELIGRMRARGDSA
jgi:hypothetical protein